MDINVYLSRVMFTNEERVEIKFQNEFNDCQNSKKRKHSIVTRLINCNRIRLKKKKKGKRNGNIIRQTDGCLNHYVNGINVKCVEANND